MRCKAHISILTLALLASACDPYLRRCSEGCSPNARCDQATQLCVEVASDGGNNVCTPACSAASECLNSTCAARYQAVTLTAPPRIARSAARLVADLVRNPSATAADPPELVLALDGGALTDDAGSPVTKLLRTDAGHYEAVAFFPPVEGLHQLFAALPAAGLSAATLTRVDLTAPRAELRLSAPPPRTDDGGLISSDPAAPQAYRRDESVTVTIDSQDSDIGTASFDLLSGTTPLQRFSSLDAGCSSRFVGGACRQQQVDLWRHPMLAYRLPLSIIATASDDVGNSSAFDGGALTVTRHKWRRSFDGFVASVAVTTRGHLIVFQRTAVGSVTSISPEGAPAWQQMFSFSSEGFAMVGDTYVYAVDQNLSGVNTSAFFEDGGSVGNEPYYAGSPSFARSGPPVLVSRGADKVHVPIMDTGRLYLHSVDWGVRSRITVDAGTTASSQFLNPISDNRSIFVPTHASNFSSGDTSKFSFPFAAGFPSAFDSPIAFGNGAIAFSAAAVRENEIAYGLTDGGRPGALWRTPPGPISVPLAGPSLAIGATTIYLNEGSAPAAGQPTLCSVPLTGTLLNCVDVQSYGGAPILGANSPFGRSVYVSTVDNVTTQVGFRVKAIDATTLTPQWETPLVVNGAFTRARSIDCSRDSSGRGLPGRPGVLYMTTSVTGTSTTTNLDAIIVDSPGIDATAAWPMETHDPRNTNNVATSLLDFSCP